MVPAWSVKLVSLFILIQLASLVLTLVGIPVTLYLLAVHGDFGWPRWSWLWCNDVDGFGPKPGFWNEFVWLALRNPVNNLRFVKGVSAVGRPLWRRTWGSKPGGWYVQAGWNNSGFPVLSGGRNVNPW